MKSIYRRFGMSVIASAVVASAFSSSQAGVVPWIYDAIFGPAYYSPYVGPYAPGYGYSAGYMPSPCGPSGCKVNCSPCQSACSTGRCSPQVSYCNPCEVSSTKCDAPSTSWKAGQTPTPAKARVETKVQSPTIPMDDYDKNGQTKTYRNNDDTNAEYKKIITSEPATDVKPKSNSFKSTPPANTVVPPADETNFEKEFEKPFESPKPKLNLNQPTELTPEMSSKPTWSASPVTHTRLTRKSQFGDVKIARRTIDVPVSTETKSSGTIVKK